MTPEQQYLTTMAQAQAAQLRDPPPTPVCPPSPEGAMPLQSATLPHKKFPIPKSGPVAAAQDEARGQTPYAALHPQTVAWLESVAKGAPAAYEGAASGGSAGSANLGLADIAGNAQRSTCTAPGCGCGAPCEDWRAKNEALRAAKSVTLDASKLPDWKDLDLRPGSVLAMNPEPKLESYEGIPAEVINEARILGSDAPHRIIEKIEEQMKGQWAMVRLPPEEMVNVRGEQRSVDEYCVATPVACAVPSREEALAMREMVEKAAEAMRGRGAAMPERSFLNAPRQHDSPLSARVVPAGEAPDPKVGW